MTSSSALKSCVLSAAKEFFSANSIDAQEASSEVPLAKGSSCYSASLGFSGEKIKGSLLLLCDEGSLKETHPMREMTPDLPTQDLADWAGEIANQIVGNLKRMVASYKLDFLLGTPTIVKGSDVQVPAGSAPGGERLNNFFKVGACAIRVVFTIELEKGLILEEKDPGTTQAQGGDSLLF